MSMHHHDAVEHSHDHTHVVHYMRHGSEITHLSSTHEHGHNHPALDHDHDAHEDPDSEHMREAHIHDHGHPTT